jgi:hypothetical protein
MFEFLGAAYGPLKDAYKALKAKADLPEKEKLVDFDWPVKSGFQEDAKKQGWDIGWTRPDKVASREIDGYQIMYEVDKKNSCVYRLVLRDGLVLIGKKSE